MVASENNIAREDSDRRKIIIVVAVVAVVIIGGLFYLLMRAGSGGGVNPPARLEGAIRAGSPEWDKYSKSIWHEEPLAYDSKPLLGGPVMTFHTTVRNLTGRTINGLEIWVAVVDHQDKTVRERTAVVIPTELHPELEPNKTMEVTVPLNFAETDDRKDIKLEITGFKLK
jgi:hypothetical protein